VAATAARNVREQNADAPPRIADPFTSIDDDVILLGSPIWNVRPPMILSTFAETFDFTGKTIHPFVTYAVSDLGTTIDTYRDLSADATASLATETETPMSTEEEHPTRAKQLIGDFAPKLVSLTDDVLFGDIWARTELSPRDRSLITVAALIAGGNTEQLPGHLERARQNGATETELKEVIIHLAFYAGWPKAMSAIQVAKRAFES
jgi:4-carboxymuconolactone decarboxylase